jgi:hypothetical protein
MNGAPLEVGAVPGVLDRATVTARRAAVHAELLAAMQAVERYRGALAILDELLSLEGPSA